MEAFNIKALVMLKLSKTLQIPHFIYENHILNKIALSNNMYKEFKTHLFFPLDNCLQLLGDVTKSCLRAAGANDLLQQGSRSLYVKQFNKRLQNLFTLLYTMSLKITWPDLKINTSALGCPLEISYNTCEG